MSKYRIRQHMRYNEDGDCTDTWYTVQKHNGFWWRTFSTNSFKGGLIHWHFINEYEAETFIKKMKASTPVNKVKIIVVKEIDDKPSRPTHSMKSAWPD